MEIESNDRTTTRTELVEVLHNTIKYSKIIKLSNVVYLERSLFKPSSRRN